MLFLTVYGPELESLFCSIHHHTQCKGAMSYEQICATYVPTSIVARRGQTKNIDDALGYLKAARLVEGEKFYTSPLPVLDTTIPFGMLLLSQFRKMENVSSTLSAYDLLYITLLESLYIKPQRVWISDLHAEINQLALARQIGGISQEKVGAWKRVMEFLGIGYRMGNGFYCIFKPELVQVVVQRWPAIQGTLQEFLEGYLQDWFPCLSAQGDIAPSIAATLEQLASNGFIRLSPQQDSPARPYFGNRYLKGIEIL